MAASTPVSTRPRPSRQNEESNWVVCALNSDTNSSDFSNGELKNESRGEAFVRSKATMKFTVSHPIIVNSHGGDVDPLYYTTYNRNLFNIAFETTVHKGKKSGIAGNSTKIKFETQVRLQRAFPYTESAISVSSSIILISSSFGKLPETETDILAPTIIKLPLPLFLS